MSNWKRAAQRIVDEYFEEPMQVVRVEKMKEPLSVRIFFSDGTKTVFTGLPAQKVMSGKVSK